MNTRGEEAVTNYSDEPEGANQPTQVIETYGREGTGRIQGWRAGERKRWRQAGEGEGRS